jgi:hypothetical protein
MAVVNQLLGRLGVNPRVCRALVRALVLMDLRSPHYGRATGTRPGEVIAPLYWVIGQYLFISTIVTALLFARVDVWAFAFVGLALSMLLVVNAVVVEFNEVVLDLEDRDVLGPRPVSPRTYAAARFANLGFYVALLTLALNLFPAVVGAGLRDAGPWYLPAYALACVLGNLTAVALTVLVYSLAPPRPGRQDVRDVLAWTQIVLTLVVFYGGQLILRNASHAIEVFLSEPPAWFSWLPPAWLANFVAEAATRPGLHLLAWAAAAGVATGLVAFLALVRLARFYAEAQPGGPDEASAGAVVYRPRPFVGRLARWLTDSRADAASLALCLRLLRRDHDLRMRMLPPLTLAIAAAAMGLFSGQLGNPFTEDAALAVLSVAAVQLLVLAVPSLLHQMRFSRSHAAAWALEVAPVPSVRAYAEGARLAVCYAIALPVLVALGVVFAVVWRDPASAALHCGLGWIAVLAVSHASVPGVRLRIPFAREAARGEITGAIVPFLAAVATVALLLGVVELQACRSRSPVLLLAYALGLLIVLRAARWARGRAGRG